MIASDTPTVSIVTGCYRSGPFISRIFNSLARQTFLPYEWIAVVDGQLDDTELRLREFARAGPFPIRIRVFPENRGARSAISEGIRLAAGSFVMILDHDDELVPHALETMVKAWNAFPGDRGRLSGVGARCLDPERGEAIGTPFPANPCITNELELRHRFNVTGELTGIVRADILKRYYLDGGKFVTNGLIWRTIAKSYQGIYLDNPLRIYHRDNPESMSLQRVVRQPAGQIEQIVADSNLSSEFLWSDPIYFAKQLWHLNRLVRHCHMSMWAVAARLRSIPLRLAYVGASLLSPVQVYRDRRKGIVIEDVTGDA